jgi:hypothetical protein
MCWNSTVSLNTFIFGLFAVCFAISNGVLSIPHGLYYLSFISIQLIEYFTWKNLDNKKINKILSQLGLFIIFFQVLVFILAHYNGPYKPFIIMLYLLYFTFLVTYFKIDFSMTVASNKHLAWNWLNFPHYAIFIWFAFLLGILLYNKDYKWLIIHFCLISAIYYTYYKTRTWGSLWCWIANIFAIGLIYRVFYKDFCTL